MFIVRPLTTLSLVLEEFPTASLGGRGHICKLNWKLAFSVGDCVKNFHQLVITIESLIFDVGWLIEITLL